MNNLRTLHNFEFTRKEVGNETKAAGGFIENIDDVIAQSVLIGRDEIVSDVLDAWLVVTDGKTSLGVRRTELEAINKKHKIVCKNILD